MNAGEPAAPGPQPAAPVESAQAGRPRLEDRPWFVLAIVFGAALFLGYPILWNCPALSRGVKIVVTVLVAIESVLVFWAFWAVMRWSYQSVVESF